MATNDNEKKVFTIDELMKRWGCSRKSILDRIHAKQLAAFKLGLRTYRITEAEVIRVESAAA